MKCILTGKEVNFERYKNHYHYTLEVAKNEVDIFICSNCKDEIKPNVKPFIIEGLIANKKWPERTEIVSEECSIKGEVANSETIVFPNYFISADFPKIPKEKLEYLFLNLFNLQKFDGDIFTILLEKNNFLVKNYFQNLNECLFYINGLQDQGLINIIRETGSIEGYQMTIQITHLGLSKSIELTEEGNNSNKCFIAMSFNPATKNAREAIRKALIKTNYEAVIIDEQIIDSERTINDEIIASLKRCKFCIADFSFHSNGVYFESGFALGQGKKVIYTCSKEEFENSHFDIKPLQHIIYKSTEQLTEDLINKIEAYID